MVNNTRDSRSVSSTLHDRAATSAPQTIRQPRAHHRQRESGAHVHGQRRSSSQVPSASGTSPHTARETFLTYFFGQNGQNGQSLGGASSGSGGNGMGVGLSAAAESGVVPSGRDMAQPSAPSGLMAGKRGVDGNSAAYDMKSLGKHIEAVSPPLPSNNLTSNG